VILNHIDNGIVVYNPSHEVIFSNSKAKSLLKAEDDLELIQALQLKLARYLALLN
jgi:sensor histidine kinase regulating citrate/malate metabolism